MPGSSQYQGPWRPMGDMGADVSIQNGIVEKVLYWAIVNTATGDR